MSRGYQAAPGSKSRTDTIAFQDFLGNTQSPPAGVSSSRLKHHRGKACLPAASPPEQLPFYDEVVEMYDDDAWTESSATPVAGMRSTRVHPSVPLFKSSYRPGSQPIPGSPCIMDIKTKKKVAGPQATNPVEHTDELMQASGKTWRRMAYSHPGAQQNWKLKNTNKRLDLSQSLSLQSFNSTGMAGEQAEWKYSKPQYYFTTRNEPKYFLAGAEDSCPASARTYFKADLPPTKGHVKYNDSMSMPYFERQRKSFGTKAGNPQLETSADFHNITRPFGVSARFSPRNSNVLQRSGAERGVSAEGQARQSTYSVSRESSLRSVRSVQESPAGSLQGSRRDLNIESSSGGYPVQKTSNSARPRYERALPGTTSASSARGSSAFEKSPSASSAPSKIVPRSPLTWEHTTPRSLQMSGSRDAGRGGRDGRLATGRSRDTPRLENSGGSMKEFTR